MRIGAISLCMMAVMALAMVSPGAAATAAAGAPTTAGQPDEASAYAELPGEVVLDNPRVRVRKFILQPGQSGRIPHAGDELVVFVRGGILTAAGRSVLWRDGRVLWWSAAERGDTGHSNGGQTPIEMICTTFKPVAPAATVPGQPPKYRYLNYPNIPGEDLLENDLVIVQRFTVNPGQWEGVHAHHPDMLYIHIRGGQWAARSKREPEHPYPAPTPDDKVGWEPTIDLSEGHESGNIGKTPIDLIWVTLKK